LRKKKSKNKKEKKSRACSRGRNSQNIRRLDGDRQKHRKGAGNKVTTSNKTKGKFMCRKKGRKKEKQGNGKNAHRSEKFLGMGGGREVTERGRAASPAVFEKRGNGEPLDRRQGGGPKEKETQARGAPPSRRMEGAGRGGCGNAPHNTAGRVNL